MRSFCKQLMEADAKTHSQTLDGEKKYVGGLHRVPPLVTCVIPWKRVTRNCDSQGFLDTERARPAESTKQGHRGSQRLKQKSQSLHGSVLGPLHICYGCGLDFFCGNSNSGSGVSLILLSVLQTFFLLLGSLAYP